MIQEKDFLYRVPVKNALVTAPGQQVRNPEILVDVEGGEFMRGNILDANSTNKLINQSVKDAVDNKLIESGYVIKELLENETKARTKGDEDLGVKIKAEQTRATGVESNLQTAISAKQNAGNYIEYSSKDNDEGNYELLKGLKIGKLNIDNDGISCNNDDTNFALSISGLTGSFTDKYYAFGPDGLEVDGDTDRININTGSIGLIQSNINQVQIDSANIILGDTNNPNIQINGTGIKFAGKSSNEIPTANGSFININNYILKSVYDKKIAALEARITALEVKHPETAA